MRWETHTTYGSCARADVTARGYVDAAPDISDCSEPYEPNGGGWEPMSSGITVVGQGALEHATRWTVWKRPVVE